MYVGKSGKQHGFVQCKVVFKNNDSMKVTRKTKKLENMRGRCVHGVETAYFTKRLLACMHGGPMVSAHTHTHTQAESCP